MNKNKIKMPGLRIVKTVIAVAVVLILSYISGGKLEPYEMAVVAVIAIQSDVADSLNEVKNRIASTIIGGIIGTIVMSLLYITESDVLKVILVSLGVFTILYLCSKLINHSEFIIIACYVFLDITLLEEPSFSWTYPIMVVLNTFVASIVAMVINILMPIKKEEVRKIK